MKALKASALAVVAGLALQAPGRAATGDPPAHRTPVAPDIKYFRPGSQFAVQSVAPGVYAISEPDYAMLDRQYRATLDEPVGMLGEITPRAAALTAAGRDRLSAWLKHLENRSGSQPDSNDPMATYDFTWMWRELGIEKLRR